MAENQIINPNRIALIDFLRGFALLGVVISNYMAFQNPGVEDLYVNRFLKLIEEIFFGPVWISLSFLFGFGFWTLLAKYKIEHTNRFLVFSRRMIVLLLIGLMNACIFEFDILRDFAFLGMFLFITPYFNKKDLLKLTIFLTFCIPFLRAYTTGFELEGIERLKEIRPMYMSSNLVDVLKYNWEYIKIVQIQNKVYFISIHFEIFCCFLWGVLSNRFGVFQNEKYILKIAKNVLLISLLGIVMIWAMNLIDQSIKIQISKIYNLKVLQEFLFAVFTFSTITIIYQSGILRKMFGYMTIYGRMTLTNYLAQSIFSLLIFSGAGLGIGRDQPLWIYFTIGLIVYIFQLIISVHWSKKFQLGPGEWLWRSLSAWKILPVKKSV